MPFFPSLRNCFSYPVLVSPLLTSDATSAIWALYLFSSYDSGISFCKLGKLFHISSYIVSGFGAFFPFIEPLLKLWSLGPVNYAAIWYKNMAYVYVSLCVCVWEQVKIITKKKKNFPELGSWLGELNKTETRRFCCRLVLTRYHILRTYAFQHFLFPFILTDLSEKPRAGLHFCIAICYHGIFDRSVWLRHRKHS